MMLLVQWTQVHFLERTVYQLVKISAAVAPNRKRFPGGSEGLVLR